MQDLGVRVLFQGINMQRLLGGLLITGRIALVSIILSTVLGIAFGLLMLRKNKIINILCRIYLEAIRIIPLLVWLFIFYFGVTKAFRIHLDGEVVCIIVFTLWGTAEMGDIVRGAVTSLPVHQKESGKAIGLTDLQIYRYIIIPQAVRRLVPAAINLATRMIKTTSLAVLIGVIEVLKIGQQIIESSILKTPTASLWVYGFIFFLYFIICYPVTIFSRKLEEKWQS
ncbi:amino acid ABC transporter membrane protein 2 (PAAT family) [Alkalibaculum bacchi]|uniref:Amino acid ABC transporter membrane protein 2 (PAAT family) n=1 Tax=Alkalibaculum bacchi TaxID=645887 RepID=A0A366I5D4_9FIRM|nr:amino acid ABC transporter permease [Alkalibaculum bacchi]RBP63374.1 amino acid ABC transporter membrane protein 2 (PAAT family) [Alkalibaculum bacchi]